MPLNIQLNDNIFSCFKINSLESTVLFNIKIHKSKFYNNKKQSSINNAALPQEKIHDHCV